MEEYEAIHKKSAALGRRGAERCHDGIRWCLRVKLAPKDYIQLVTHEGRLVGEMIGSSEDINLLEFKLLSAARSSEKNQQSSVLTSEPGEFATNGLVSWGKESWRPSEDGTAYISDDGLEIALVGRDNLQNM
jgi:hypothetical protein